MRGLRYPVETILSC
ncbi:MAG TPA: hypothetical protein VGP73_06990 [Thermoanaerobaculia bacterium]